jgi:hypothetical protein
MSRISISGRYQFGFQAARVSSASLNRCIIKRVNLTNYLSLAAFPDEG